MTVFLNFDELSNDAFYQNLEWNVRELIVLQGLGRLSKERPGQGHPLGARITFARVQVRFMLSKSYAPESFT